jgi:hypothetical protein
MGLFDNVSFDKPVKTSTGKAKIPQVHFTMSSFDIVRKVSEMRGINCEVSKALNTAVENYINTAYNDFQVIKSKAEKK